MECVYEVSILPVLGPLGVLGVLTVSVVCDPLMVTDLVLDQLETTLVCVAHRAWAFPEYVPALPQVEETLVEDDQFEVSPGSQ